MRNRYRPVLAAAACVAIAAPLLAIPQKDEPKGRLQTDANQELKELEAQRAKLDERIKAARKKAGLPPETHGFAFSDEDVKALHGLGGDHQIIIKKSIEGASEAIKKAFEQKPHGESFKFDFDFDKEGNALELFGDKDTKTFRIWTDKDGKVHKSAGNLTEDEQKQFEQQIGKMNVEIRRNLKGQKDLKIEMPEVRVFSGGKLIIPKNPSREKEAAADPRLKRSGEEGELRAELRALRGEVEKLRDEVKRARSGKTANPNLDTLGRV